MLYKCFLIHIYSVLVSWKNGSVLEKSWKLAGNPVRIPFIGHFKWLLSYIFMVIINQYFATLVVYILSGEFWSSPPMVS